MSLPGDAINDVEQLQQKQPPAEATLVMDWGHGEKTRKLNRRVSVLGEEHPSTMRMHGLGLRACELGIVCIGTRVWAIQLNPETVPEEQPMVRELIPGGESTWVGDVHIWAGEKGVYSSSRFGNPPTGETHEAAVASTPSARHTDTNPPEKTPTPAVQVPEKVVVSSPSINDPSRTDAAERSLNADEIADHFTQRLLEKTEKRTNRESLIRWSATGGLLLSALLVAGYVLIRGVLPIFQAIYSE